MLGTLLALVLIVALLLTVGRTIQATVSGVGPAYVALRRVWIAQTVRRESADLDRQYEQLLRR
jgi:hypothetical protein